MPAWNPSITPRAAEPLWQPRAPLMGKPPRMVVWPCRSFKGAAEAALTAQVPLLGRQVTHLAAPSAEPAVQQAAVVGVTLTATKSAQPGPGRLGFSDSGQKTEGRTDRPLGKKIY